MKEATTREFFDASWSIYERILDRNYMFHQELYQEVQHLLGDRSIRRSVVGRACKALPTTQKLG
jgi:hypothetical protein